MDHFSNGEVYQGEYANGRPNGHGRYEWPNGCTYEGEFK